MEPTRVLFTVPHATCPIEWNERSDGHPCDTSALELARCLSAGVEGSILLPGDISRDIVDLNRIQSRYTSKFREFLRQIVRSHSKRLGLLVDVHSFPGGTKGPRTWSTFDIVFIDDRVPESRLVASLADTLRHAGFRVLLDHGSGNDIQDEMHDQFALESILVEINESASNQRRREICQALSFAITGKPIETHPLQMNIEKTCDWCQDGLSNVNIDCPRCHAEVYCSRDCRRSSWTKGGHGMLCQASNVEEYDGVERRRLEKPDMAAEMRLEKGESSEAYASRLFKHIKTDVVKGPQKYGSRVYGTPRCQSSGLARYGLSIPSAQQRFTRDYFRPDSHLPGILLYGDVGSGKTASALGILSQWLPLTDWRIIWATKKELVGSVSKDFWATGDAALAEQRILVVSYKQFTNLVEGKTARWKSIGFDAGAEGWTLDTSKTPLLPGQSKKDQIAKAKEDDTYGDLLDKETWIWKGPKRGEDVLHRTIVVIDEVHLLFKSSSIRSQNHDPWLIGAAVSHNRAKSRASTEETPTCRTIGLSATPVGSNPLRTTQMLSLFTREKIDNNDDKTTLSRKLAGVVSRFDVSRDADHFARALPFEIVESTLSDRQGKMLETSFEPIESDLLESSDASRSKKELPVKTRKQKSNMIRDIRFRENFLAPGGTSRSYLPDFLDPTKPSWDPDAVNGLSDSILEGRFPKLESLLDKIRTIDQLDMLTEGRTHKHVIFSDTGMWRGSGLVALFLHMAGYRWRTLVRKTGTSWNLLEDSGLARSTKPGMVEWARRHGPLVGPDQFVMLSRTIFFSSLETDQRIPIVSQGQTLYYRLDYRFQEANPLYDILTGVLNMKPENAERFTKNFAGLLVYQRSHDEWLRRAGGERTRRWNTEFLVVRTIREEQGLPSTDVEVPVQSLLLYAKNSKTLPGYEAQVLRPDRLENRQTKEGGKDTWTNKEIDEELAVLRDLGLVVRSLDANQKDLNKSKERTILSTFNNRDNIFGKDSRIIVIDKPYKEGIDVYDAMYFHMLEEEASDQDRIQAVGRAIRRCGHQVQLWGTSMNSPRQWTLSLFKYRIMGATLTYPSSPNWAVVPIDEEEESVPLVILIQALAQDYGADRSKAERVSLLRRLLSDVFPVDLRITGSDAESPLSRVVFTGFRIVSREDVFDERSLVSPYPLENFDLYIEEDAGGIPIRALYGLTPRKGALKGLHGRIKRDTKGRLYVLSARLLTKRIILRGEDFFSDWISSSPCRRFLLTALWIFGFIERDIRRPTKAAASDETDEGVIERNQFEVADYEELLIGRLLYRKLHLDFGDVYEHEDPFGTPLLPLSATESDATESILRAISENMREGGVKEHEAKRIAFRHLEILVKAMRREYDLVDPRLNLLILASLVSLKEIYDRERLEALRKVVGAEEEGREAVLPNDWKSLDIRLRVVRKIMPVVNQALLAATHTTERRWKQFQLVVPGLSTPVSLDTRLKVFSAFGSNTEFLSGVIRAATSTYPGLDFWEWASGERIEFYGGKYSAFDHLEASPIARSDLTSLELARFPKRRDNANFLLSDAVQGKVYRAIAGLYGWYTRKDVKDIGGVSTIDTIKETLKLLYDSESFRLDACLFVQLAFLVGKDPTQFESSSLGIGIIIELIENGFLQWPKGMTTADQVKAKALGEAAVESRKIDTGFRHVVSATGPAETVFFFYLEEKENVFGTGRGMRWWSNVWKTNALYLYDREKARQWETKSKQGKEAIDIVLDGLNVSRTLRSTSPPWRSLDIIPSNDTIIDARSRLSNLYDWLGRGSELEWTQFLATFSDSLETITEVTDQVSLLLVKNLRKADSSIKRQIMQLMEEHHGRKDVLLGTLLVHLYLFDSQTLPQKRRIFLPILPRQGETSLTPKQKKASLAAFDDLAAIYRDDPHAYMWFTKALEARLEGDRSDFVELVHTKAASPL